MRSLKYYFGVYFPRFFVTREINTKINISWGHKQFATRVHSLLYIYIYIYNYFWHVWRRTKVAWYENINFIKSMPPNTNIYKNTNIANTNNRVLFYRGLGNIYAVIDYKSVTQWITTAHKYSSSLIPLSSMTVIFLFRVRFGVSQRRKVKNLFMITWMITLTSM